MPKVDTRTSTLSTTNTSDKNKPIAKRVRIITLG